MLPETRYAKASDGVHIAYQVLGEGPIDLIFIMGWTSNIEAMWEEPALAGFMARLASLSRLIVFDKRGCGLSDRVPETRLPTLETRVDDVRAVMDAADSKRGVVFGVSEGGPMSMLFAATHPDRTMALVLFGTMPRFAWAPDFPWGQTGEQLRETIEAYDRAWGTLEHASAQLHEWAAPSMDHDGQFTSWLASYLRRAASPGAAIALERMNHEIDVRDILPAIHKPTLVLARTDDIDFPSAATRQMAARIEGASYVELPGADHLFWIGDQHALLREVERFLKELGAEETESTRILTTVLFTDVVGSTAKLASIGDARWRQTLNDHHARIRALLLRYRGREIGTTGDGFVATFDGPIRAIRCALASVRAVRDLGLEIRAGLHTGEVELDGEDVRGIAVHIGARVAGLAAPSETLVSSTVKDLVAGSALRFEDRGAQTLKGVPGQWHLYRVLDD